MSRPITRMQVAATALVALVFSMAPTAGDVGSCGQEAVDLDPITFFAGKRSIDCRQCKACGLDTLPCRTACDAPPAEAFPKGCDPLVHDGEVCLRALQTATCDDYATFMSDTAPVSPTECQFCPR